MGIGSEVNCFQLNPITTMKDFSHIKDEVSCKPASPYERAGIIAHLQKLGVPIYRETKGNAKTHPNLCWFEDELCATFSEPGNNDRGKTWLSVSDFVALFEAPALPKIGDWQPTIIVDRKTLKVGFTEIPFSTVEAIYKAMK